MAYIHNVISNYCLIPLLDFETLWPPTLDHCQTPKLEQSKHRNYFLMKFLSNHWDGLCSGGVGLHPSSKGVYRDQHIFVAQTSRLDFSKVQFPLFLKLIASSLDPLRGSPFPLP